MNILITGAKGFLGKNLTAALLARAEARDLTLFPADVDTPGLRAACQTADFVYHLAGVNRPEQDEDFQRGNADLTAQVLDWLREGRCPPVALSSSIQAALDNPYGRSKRASEDAARAYQDATGAPVYIYRLPNAFGKWSRPNYNSAVATFCHNIARDLPIQVSDPAARLRLVYIDDIVDEFLRALDGSPTREGGFCAARPERETTLGELTELLRRFHAGRDNLDLVDQSDPFVRKLYATYLSFLPADDFARPAARHSDERGSFTELLHMEGHGQISVNIAKPGVTKGQHWHHTKHEKFAVLSGKGVIRFRQVDDGEVLAYKVSGDSPTVVDIPPGYTHSIENLGESDLVTLMWANERFDPARPDTFPLPVIVKPPQNRHDQADLFSPGGVALRST